MDKNKIISQCVWLVDSINEGKQNCTYTVIVLIKKEICLLRPPKLFDNSCALFVS